VAKGLRRATQQSPVSGSTSSASWPRSFAKPAAARTAHAHDQPARPAREISERGSHNGVVWNLRYASWVAQGCKIVSRNLSMAEWNALLVEILPMKGPARTYAPGRELQKSLQPPFDLPRWPGVAVTTANGGTHRRKNRAIVEWETA
jgi:hypothetical protein